MQALIKVNGDIRSERLKLRPLSAHDAERLCEIFSNWNVIRMLVAPPWPYTRTDAEEFIKGALNPASENQEAPFAITEGGLLIGCIGARVREAGDLQRGAGPHIGYWLGQPYWGRGYMTEAARAFISHIFTIWRGDTIYSGAFADNAASLRVQRKLGFTVDGDAEVYSRPRDAAFSHLNTALTRTRFRQLPL